MGQFKYEKDAEGIVTIKMDIDGPVNTVGDEFLQHLQNTVLKLQNR